MTEEEAKEKWCPLTFNTEALYCQGKKCMWFTQTNPVVFKDDFHKPKYACGICNRFKIN